MVKIVLLFKFPNVLHQDFKVIGIVLFLWSVQPQPLSELRLLVDTDIEKYRDDVEFHILKPPAGRIRSEHQIIYKTFKIISNSMQSEVKSDNV